MPSAGLRGSATCNDTPPMAQRSPDKVAPPRDIHEVLRSHWGYTGFRPMQEGIVRSAMEGRDTLALLPTGGGKSICFQVPALAMGGLCIVVSPLIALMRDQVERLRDMGVSARMLVSGMSQGEIDNALESAALGKVSFLYMAPERIGTEMFQARLPRMPLRLLAVDEAHCISQWGYDFRPSYQRIPEIREHFPDVPILALTATATPAVAADIMDRLGFRVPHIMRGDMRRPELTFWVSRSEDKPGTLLRIMRRVQGSGIVYVRERRTTERLAAFLRAQGISAAAYHAGMEMGTRQEVQQRWTKGTVPVVVATNAFGMGIDKPDVRVVVHIDAPPDPESYYQEAGRAGRDGMPSHAILLTARGDEERLLERIMASFPDIDQVRRVYQSFADIHHIAHGAGCLESYALDLPTLARQAHVDQATAMNSLKALELDGIISLSEGARNPARVLITADKHAIHEVRVRDAKLAPVLDVLLRMYGGLFEAPVPIEENRMAAQLRKGAGDVVKALQRMQAQGLLSYTPRSDAPQVTLLQPRWDARILKLDPNALEARKERAAARWQVMARYAYKPDRCREAMLLDYFGEEVKEECGRCDVCRDRGIAKAAYATVPVPMNTVSDLEQLRWKIDGDADSGTRTHVQDEA